jgi:stress response protein YsnF
MATHDNRDDRNRLVELGGSDYKIKDGQPNIKGWPVKDGTGRKFGKVDELLFNPSSKKVRYMVVDLKGNEFSLRSRNVLVPIGKANLHENDDDVILPGVRAEQLEGLPDYEKGNITPSTESTIRSHFSETGSAERATTERDHDERFYEHEDFDEDRFYGKRRSSSDSIPIIEENINIDKREEETGGARVRTSMEEKDVEENINLREEHVDVNRKSTDRPATEEDFKNFEEGEKEIKEHKEVPVVNKEARVKEEVNIKKTVSEEEQTIRDKVKKTEVDIDKQNKTGDRDHGDRNFPDREDPDYRDEDDRNRDRDKF